MFPNTLGSRHAHPHAARSERAVQLRRATVTIALQFRSQKRMTRRRAFSLTLLALALICILVWVSGVMRHSSSTNNLATRFEPNGSFKGRIVVTLIERRTGPERKLKFLIDLDQGEIFAPEGFQSEGILSPGGRIDDCQRDGAMGVVAPGGELVANCTVDAGIRITKERPGDLVRQWSGDRGWDICGLVWSADSSSIAVLLEKERTDLSLSGLLSAASGHPVPLETFKVTVMSVRSESELRLPVIRKDSPSGWARIDWIQ